MRATGEHIAHAACRVDAAVHAGRPSVFETIPFDGPMLGHEQGMPVHSDLHVWLYKHNPAGMLEPWNPAVSC